MAKSLAVLPINRVHKLETVVLGLAAFCSSISSFIPGGAPKGHDALDEI